MIELAATIFVVGCACFLLVLILRVCVFLVENFWDVIWEPTPAERAQKAERRLKDREAWRDEVLR
jgi:hypothetical protein